VSNENQGSPIRRILVIKWSAMGDVALASAAIEDIARTYAHAEIDLSTLPPWDTLYAHDPRLHEVISIDVRTGHGQLGTIRRWLAAVRARRYDLVIDLQTTDRSRVLLGLLWIIGGQIPLRAGNKPAFPYNIAPARSAPARHAMQIMADNLRGAGVSMTTARPVLHCPPARRDAVAAMLRERGLAAGHFGVFLPGSQAAGYLKRWGAARFASLARLLKSHGLQRIALIGGPDELDECRRIRDRCGAWVVDLCGKTRLLDIVPICETARVVVGNDTGTAHVAAAAGKPMLVICGPTDPGRVLPAGNTVSSMQAPLPCINCYRKHCAHHSCMAWISPAMVLERLQWLGVLGNRGQRRISSNGAG